MVGRSPARDAGLRTPNQLHLVGPGNAGAHNVWQDRAVEPAIDTEQFTGQQDKSFGQGTNVGSSDGCGFCNATTFLKSRWSAVLVA